MPFAVNCYNHPVELEADACERLDRFLARSLPEHSRTRIAQHIASGCVTIDGRLRKPGFRLEPGMRVHLDPIPERQPPPDLAPVEMLLEIIYEDEWLLAVNKPPGIAVHPSPTSREPTLVHALLARSHELSKEGGEFRPGIVHRLDKDTSGLMLVAKTDSVHRALQKAIQERVVKRTYLAWVRGTPSQDAFTIRSYIGRHPKNRKKMAVVDESEAGARLAVTHFRLLDTKGDTSQLACILETGRTHQIRVHLASAGLPVWGDRVYGVAHPEISRQALHAGKLEFHHPITGGSIRLMAQTPEDIRAAFP